VRRLVSVTVILILAATSACDNVSWGGVDIHVVPPPPAAVGVPGTADLDIGEQRMPQGPVLYHVIFDGVRATMTPIGELDGDTLRSVGVQANGEAYARRFIAERLRSGAEFTLFHNGLRAGTFIVQDAEPLTGGTCEGIARATGVLELTAETDVPREFLALARFFAPPTPRQHDVSLQVDRRMQIVGPILAERLLRARGAQLPGNWQRAMAQIQPFPVGRTRDVAFTATLLVGDTLGPGPAGQTGVAHSLFFIAGPSAAQTGWDTTFVRFANYPDMGKQAPRVVDFLDWTRDGAVELVLQVWGADSFWYEAIGRSGGRWTPIFRDPCRRPAQWYPAAAGATPQTAGGPQPAESPPSNR
jgi:hypothetical protein